MNKENLTWEITPQEKREKTEKVRLLWFGVVLSFVCSIIIEVLGRSRSKEEFIVSLYTAIFIIASVIFGFLIAFILNKRIPYPKISYYLDSQGITIIKGNKKKHFLWKDFECFYLYTIVRSELNQRTKKSKIESFLEMLEDKKTAKIGKDLVAKLIEGEEVRRKIMGEIFYLKKKQSGFLSKFYKTFVVVYSEPDNWQEVLNFLKKYLPQKPIGPFTDAGLVFYEFR
jgi:F0F1-type ATP synthase membrane subunit c/vacuolar-type H+-ATPase subunit K